MCVCVLSGASREAAHVLCEPGVEFRLNRLHGLVHISRLGSPALGPLSLDLTLHLPPGLGPESRLMDLHKNIIIVSSCNITCLLVKPQKDSQKHYLSSRSCRANIVCFSVRHVCILLPWSVQSEGMSALLTVVIGQLGWCWSDPMGAPWLLWGFDGFTLLLSSSSSDPCFKQKIKKQDKATERSLIILNSDVHTFNSSGEHHQQENMQCRDNVAVNTCESISGLVQGTEECTLTMDSGFLFWVTSVLFPVSLLLSLLLWCSCLSDTFRLWVWEERITPVQLCNMHNPFYCTVIKTYACFGFIELHNYNVMYKTNVKHFNELKHIYYIYNYIGKLSRITW